MTNAELLVRIDHLIDQGSATLKSQRKGDFDTYVDAGIFSGFRSASLSFITNLYSNTHPYYGEFEGKTGKSNYTCTSSGINILKSIRHEIENGWLISLKALVSAEIFSDFLEMSEYLLKEKYKDPAAVMIGSVLEEHLRQLCNNHSIDLTVPKGTEMVTKKADLLNSDLAKAGVYGVLEQKQITGWLHLRNSAAHGKYLEYTLEQVNLMYQGVLYFITKTV